MTTEHRAAIDALKIGHAATITTLTSDKELMRDHLNTEKETLRA